MFRGTSAATRIFSQYYKTYGSNYLRDSLTATIEAVLAENNLEVWTLVFKCVEFL